jgi:endonuclease/exonuclease/phosphatase family metal-dependent hydrolase
LIILTLLTGERFLSGVLLIAFILVAIRFIPNFTPPLESTSLDNGLKVMSFNVFQRNTDIDALVELILEHEPDILALQELTPEISEQMVSKLVEVYPYHLPVYLDDMDGQGVLSRYPIRQLSNLPDYRYQRVQVDTPEGSISVFNIHSPKLLPFKWKEDWHIQRSFFESLLAEIANADSPIIVLGDFNTTPQSEHYALLTGDLTDTFIESGWGLGFSYPARPKLGISLPTPIVRIDYIFISNHFTSNDTRVLKESSDSDHRPVVSELILK